MNRTEALKALEPISGVASRRIDRGASKVNRVDGEVLLRPGNRGRVMTLTDEGVGSLLGFAGMPAGMMENLTPATFGTAASELIDRRGDYTVITKDNQVVHFTDKPHTNVAPSRVLTLVERAMGNEVAYKPRILNEDSVALEVIGTRKEAEVAGDLVRAGVLINFSTIGRIMPMVQSFATVMSCLNGATHNTVLEQYTGGEGDDVWHWFRQSISKATRAFGRIVKDYQRMVDEGIPPDERAEVLEALLKQAGITGPLADAVRARAIAEPPETAWDVFNMVTYAVQHELEEPKQVARARKKLAQFASSEDHARICPSCHRQQRTGHAPAVDSAS